MDNLNLRQLQVHVQVVGVLLILTNALMVLAGACAFLLLGGIGLAVQDDTAMAILVTIGGLTVLFLVALALPGLVAGFGLMARRAWARVLAIVVSLLGLIAFPVGTLIGLYAAWVLFQGSAAEYFAPQASPAAPPR